MYACYYFLLESTMSLHVHLYIVSISILLPQNVSIIYLLPFTAHGQVNDSGCNSIELIVPGSGHVVRGYAVLEGSIISGRITFVRRFMQDFV